MKYLWHNIINIIQAGHLMKLSNCSLKSQSLQISNLLHYSNSNNMKTEFNLNLSSSKDKSHRRNQYEGGDDQSDQLLLEDENECEYKNIKESRTRIQPKSQLYSSPEVLKTNFSSKNEKTTEEAYSNISIKRGHKKEEQENERDAYQKQIRRLNEQKESYQKKLSISKNIIKQQQQMMSKLRRELDFIKSQFETFQMISKGKIEGDKQVKELQISRLVEKIKQKDDLIKTLETKVEERKKQPKISIEEVNSDYQVYSKHLEQLLEEQQKILESNRNEIEKIRGKILQMSENSVEQENAIRQLSLRLKEAEREKLRANMEKEKLIKKNEKLNKLIDREQKKIHELGRCIISIASSMNDTESQSFKRDWSQIIEENLSELK